MSDRERLKLFNKLCKACSRHRVIPSSMLIHDCSEGSVEIECGGFADVSQGMYEGRRVAIKVVRMYVTSDLDAIRSVSVSTTPLYLPNKYITEILSRRGRLEAPSTSQYTTASWCDVKRIPVRSGFRVDGQRKYQRLRQGGSTRKSSRACMLSPISR